MKAIQATPAPIDTILQGHQFNIPVFQRPYSWGVEECDKLWDDISSFFDNAKDQEKYFLGSIVVYPLRKNEQTWCVIDGQQRLTTLMILIKILFDKVSTMTILQAYLYPRNRNTGEIKKNELRLKSDVQASAGRDDSRDLQNVIQGKDDFTSDKSPFRVNYHHLNNKVDDWWKGKTPQKREKFINTLRDRIVLLPIECESEDDALDLFQIINDRGMRLADADIFKAKIYSAIKLEKDKKEFITRWGNLENHDSLFRSLMHISRANLEDTSKEIALRKYINDNYLKNTAKPKNDWRSIIHRLETSYWLGWEEESACNESLKAANETIYWTILECYPNDYWQYPLYVFAHKYAKNKNNGDFYFSPTIQEKYVLLLENTIRYFYIKGVVHNSVNTVKDTTYKVCEAIASGGDYVAEYRANLGSKRNDIKVFNQKLHDCDYGRCQKGLVLINSLPANKKWRVDYAEALSDGYHIEHILPRKPIHFTQWDDESHARDIEKIGNLIPLEGKINIKASNAPFAEKQKKYKKSKVRDALELSKKTPKHWHPDDVEARQKKSINRLQQFFRPIGKK